MTEVAADATGVIAEHAVKLDFSAVPEAVGRMARSVFTDTISVLYSASREAAVQTALRAFPLADGPCTVVGHGGGASATQAAFVNGVGGHDIELDDVHTSSRTHPACVIVPAAVAAAEAAGDTSGAELLAGIVAGYDVEVRLSKAMGVQQQFDRGFHPSGICGSIGAAAAAGRVLGLSVDQMRACIALGAAQSSGLLTFEEDPSHMLKSFNTGVAARNGIYAALLAQRGFRGAPDVLTGRHSVLTPYSRPDPEPAKLLDGLGERYEICFTSIKRHACCSQTHSAVDTLLALQEQYGIAAPDIAGIDVQLAHGAVAMIDGNPLWTHNIQYVLAVAAREGRIGREHFGAGWTGNAEILELAARVRLSGSDELQTRFPASQGAIVSIRTATGEHTLQRNIPVGSPDQPLSDAELRSKFDGLVGPVLAAQPRADLWTALSSLERIDSVRGLLAAS
jgi:2-methylcitrate dehydratase PrpD